MIPPGEVGRAVGGIEVGGTAVSGAGEGVGDGGKAAISVSAPASKPAQVTVDT